MKPSAGRKLNSSMPMSWRASIVREMRGDLLKYMKLLSRCILSRRPMMVSRSMLVCSQSLDEGVPTGRRAR